MLNDDVECWPQQTNMRHQNLDCNGAGPHSDKIEVIENIQGPKDIPELHRLLTFLSHLEKGEKER